MDDARAVADAAGIDEAVVIGLSEGGPLAILFATAFPERVRSLVLWGTFARVLRGPDYEIGMDAEVVEPFIAGIRDSWGTGSCARGMFVGGDRRRRHAERLAHYERQTASPGAAAEILHHNVTWTSVTRSVPCSVPTLVVHRTGDPIVPVAPGRYLAEHIADARMVEIPGDFHVGGGRATTTRSSTRSPSSSPARPAPREVDVDRVLMTVLFTDIVDSTARAAAIGDRAWRALLEQHDAAAATGRSNTTGASW